MSYQLLHQYWIGESHKYIVGPVLVPYFSNDLRLLFLCVSRWIERPNERDWLGMGKTVEFFV